MILFGCQDVGPAKYLAMLSDHSLLKGSQWIGSRLSMPIFKKNNLNCLDEIKVEPSVKLIVTGTTLGDGLDKRLLKLARQNGIQTVSIVEHWGWYAKRFQLDGGLLLPDYIFLNDQIAYEEAAIEGLPTNKLVIVGNPVLESLSGAYSATRIKDSKIMDSYRIPKKKRRILFISEQLREDFSRNGELGYDEFEVFRAIKKITGKDDQVIVKKHPEEDRNKYREICSDYIEIDDIDISDLSAISDVVIGMGSMLLLELAAYRGDVISYRPNYNGPAFIGSRMGVVKSVYSEYELMGCINANKNHEQSKMQKIFLGSKERIVNNLTRFVS